MLGPGSLSTLPWWDASAQGHGVQTSVQEISSASDPRPTLASTSGRARSRVLPSGPARRLPRCSIAQQRPRSAHGTLALASEQSDPNCRSNRPRAIDAELCWPCFRWGCSTVSDVPGSSDRPFQGEAVGITEKERVSRWRIGRTKAAAHMSFFFEVDTIVPYRRVPCPCGFLGRRRLSHGPHHPTGATPLM